MRIKLLDSNKISDNQTEFTFHQGAWARLDRRSFIRFSGLATIAFVSPDCLLKKQAEANPALINAILNSIGLLRGLWQVKEPTRGTVNIVNNSNIVKYGYIEFAVIGPRGAESTGYFPYEVPPRVQNLYEFIDGPYGLFPGQKAMEGRTAMGQRQTYMEVAA